MAGSTADTTNVNRSRRDMPRRELPPGIRGLLRVLEGPDEGAEHKLDAPICRLGRDASNSIQLSDPAASSKHAMIYFAQSMEWRLEDMNSTNGTLLNGSQVRAYSLRDGDKILIGDTLMVFFVEHTR